MRRTIVNLLSLDKIEKFSAPIGRVFISCSNLEWAISNYVYALDGNNDIAYSDNEFQRKPIAHKIKILRKKIKGTYTPREIISILDEIDSMIDKRNILSHGQFFSKISHLDDESIEIMKFDKGKSVPNFHTFSIHDIINLDLKFYNATTILSIYAYHLRRKNKI